ncbi:MAG TPA: arginyltransferase [Arcobacter sp.]|nr:arginyltransferase [Arcobacter sp.]HIP55958.1 arginyltransferase [Arcobacter sp.]
MNNEKNITEILEESKQCAYFDDKLADTRYKFMKNCDATTYHKMLERGWRRFGNVHFRPECVACDECKTIRIKVEDFKFSKSQKRIMSKNKDIQVYVQKPSLSMDHINLFNKYHKYMETKKGWKKNNIDVQDYQQSYVDGASTFGKEILYFLDDKLIGIALSDMTKDSLSCVYCFYDHEYENRSLGKFSILAQMSIAKQAKIPHLFLGYWIKDHYSMGYKEDYAPFEILQNTPLLDEECIWEKYEK